MAVFAGASVFGDDPSYRIELFVLSGVVIGGGFDKVYEMGRMFRNEGMSIKHNPEYTAIELYQAYADYTDMMEITENVIAHMAEAATGSMKINYQGLYTSMEKNDYGRVC